MARRPQETIHRTVAGIVRCHPPGQAAIPYADLAHDPSLGMPHLDHQIQNRVGEQAPIAPEPDDTHRFMLPPWSGGAR